MKRDSAQARSERELAEKPPAQKSLISLWFFFLLCAILSWAVWLWPMHKNGGVYINLLGLHFDFPFILLKLVLGNCLPGALATVWVLAEGRAQFRFLMASLGKWRTQLGWYLLAVTMPGGLFLTALVLDILLFPTQHALPPASQFFKSFLLTLPFGPLWEELAWRAFVLRKLQLCYSRPASALVLGAYWAFWHIPLWLVTLNLDSNTKLPVISLAFANVVAWSVIFAYLYNRSSQSLPTTILMHATYVAATSQAFAAVPYGQVHLIEISTLLSVCLAAILVRPLGRSNEPQNAQTVNAHLELNAGKSPERSLNR